MSLSNMAWISILSVIALLALLVTWRLQARRRSKIKRRWQVVSDGKGCFTFIDGEGDLPPIDYRNREDADAAMFREQAEPAFEAKRSQQHSEGRERAYQSGL